MLNVNRQRLNHLLLQGLILRIDHQGTRLFMKHEVHQLKKTWRPIYRKDRCFMLDVVTKKGSMTTHILVTIGSESVIYNIGHSVIGEG